MPTTNHTERATPRAVLQQLINRQLDHDLQMQLKRFVALSEGQVPAQAPDDRRRSLDDDICDPMGDDPLPAMLCSSITGAFSLWGGVSFPEPNDD